MISKQKDKKIPSRIRLGDVGIYFEILGDTLGGYYLNLLLSFVY